MADNLRVIESASEAQKKECISVAEELLEKAKSGEIIGFVVVADCGGNEWEYLITPTQDRLSLLGKVHAAAWRISNKLFTE